MIAVLGGLVYLERDLARTRTAEGRSRAQAQGKHMGRTPGPLDYAGFKVATEADLDSFARRIEKHGIKVEEIPAGEQPGLGRR